MAEVMEMRLEAVPLPVEDVDTSKAFYIERVGFMLDHDVEPGERYACRPADAAWLGVLDRHRQRHGRPRGAGPRPQPPPGGG